ncbi:major facilitator superfamily domain-containing protein [Phlebopus sp. FC_14]|nr:major facilitator superfamily domain-containing protein [Phlebopus sp. FC_14]
MSPTTRSPIELSSPSPSSTACSSGTPENVSSAHPADDVPDGGYGWVVVSACSIITAFFVGLSYSWAEKLAPDSTLAFIGSVAVSCVAFGAVPNVPVIHWLGTRKAAVLGCYSVGGLFFTNGIIVELGCSLCFLACGTLYAQWFKRRRGGGIGGCIQTIVMQVLIDKVGIRWTFRIMGFITLIVTVPAAMLLKERHRRSTVAIDWSLFKDPKFFVLLSLGSGIATIPSLVPPFFIPLYAPSLNLSKNLGSVFLALFNISSAVGPLGLARFSDVVGPMGSLVLALVVSAIRMLDIRPESNALAPFIMFVIVNGLGNGGFFSTMPSVIGHIYGSRVSIAFAMVVTSWFVGYIMGAPVAGAAGRAAYRPAMYYAGTVSLGNAVIILVARHLSSKRFFAFA